MNTKTRLLQVLWVLLAAGFFFSASLLQGPLTAQSERLGLILPGDTVNRQFPQLTILNWMPGGLRAPLISYFWIRSQELDQQGRYWDAMQTADMICALQPKFATNWDYQAWRMAWNISVQTHTPQERWTWIHNGISLLRDKGIPANPRSERLYQALGWIFYFKVGGDTDEMNLTYKQRWAGIMQHLLGAPPAGDTAAVIDAFRPNADPKLLDKGVSPDSEHPIQARKRAELLRDNPDAADLAKELAALAVEVDRTLLDAYNHYSDEHAASIVRPEMPSQVKPDQELRLTALLNDPKKAAALHKLLAFVRAQYLWNEFKMDPQYMLGLMEKFMGKYAVPLDWRSPHSHGLYWAMLGIETCNAKGVSDTEALSTDRIVLYCLKDMTWFGKMSLIENPRNPDYPQITRMADVRYIDPAHAQSVDFANAVAGVRQEKFDENIFRDGHRNYLKTSIMMLVPMGKVKRAQELYDWIKREYRMTGGEWNFKDVRDWVVWALNSEGSPIPAVASSQITAALQTAFESLAKGDPASMTEYRDMMAYAKMVYDKYQEKAVARNRFGPYNEFGAMVLTEILVEPRNWGLDALYPITTRSELYKALQLEWPVLLPMVYDPITMPLRFQCQAKGIDFTKAFPQPDGLEEYRAKRAEQFRVAPPITN